MVEELVAADEIKVIQEVSHSFTNAANVARVVRLGCSR